MDSRGSNGSMRSGELARLSEVSTDTLRHYERVGVLAKPPRTNGGYRQYPSSALERVRLVRRAMSVGFSLEELARVLRVRDKGGAPCRQVRDLAASKLELIERRIEELALVRDQLEKLLKEWDGRLAGTAPGDRAYLLDSISRT
jgi:MerR family copper efflux transcriptional regulator